MSVELNVEVCNKGECGYCCYVFCQNYSNIYALIFNLYIWPEYRGHGEARKLLLSTISIIRESGYNGEIRIEATPQENSISLDALVKFYNSMELTIIEGNKIWK